MIHRIAATVLILFVLTPAAHAANDVPKTYDLLQKFIELNPNQFDPNIQELKKITPEQFDFDNMTIKELLAKVPSQEITIGEVIDQSETKINELKEQWYKVKPKIMLILRTYLFISSLVILGVLLAITKKTFPQSATNLKSRFWESTLTGLIFYFGIPISLMLLFLTVIGIPLAFLIFVLYIFIDLLAGPITSLTISHWIAKGRNYSKPAIFLISIPTYAALLSITYIPYVWWILILIIQVPTMGSFLLERYESCKKNL